MRSDSVLLATRGSGSVGLHDLAAKLGADLVSHLGPCQSELVLAVEDLHLAEGGAHVVLGALAHPRTLVVGQLVAKGVS